MTGIEGGLDRPRLWLQSGRRRDLLKTHNVDDLRVPPQELVRLRADYNGYFWFCAKRNPVKRLISGYRGKLHKLARTPAHIVPGHDPAVLRRYPAPSPEFEGIVARLDVAPSH